MADGSLYGLTMSDFVLPCLVFWLPRLVLSWVVLGLDLGLGVVGLGLGRLGSVSVLALSWRLELWFFVAANSTFSQSLAGSTRYADANLPLVSRRSTEG